MQNDNAYHSIILIAFLFCLFSSPLINTAEAQDFLKKKTEELNTDSLIEVGGWQYGQYVSLAVDETRNFAFLTSGGVVIIFDISDLSSPVIISDTIRAAFAINDIKYDSFTQQLYLSLGYGGIEIWDLQNINSPQLLGSLPNSAGALAFKQGFLFFINGFGGVTSVNILDPANPFVINYYNPPEGVGSLDIDDSGNYIAASGTETYLFAIQADGSITLVTYNLYFGGEGLHIYGNYIYEIFPGFQGVPSTLYVLQLSTLAHLNSIPLPGNQTVGYYITSSANDLFVSDRQLGVDIFSLSNPASPGLLATFPTGCAGLSYFSDHVLVSDYSGMKIIDVSNPQMPVLTYSYEGPGGYARDIKVMGNYCYMITDYHLYVFDITIPSYTELAADMLPVSGFNLHLAIHGNYAFITNTDQGLQVVDISDPSNPSMVWSNPPAYYSVLASEGNYLYIIDNQSQMNVFDISNPVLPVNVGSITFSFPFYDISDMNADGGYVYITTSLPGSLRIIDVTDPTQPTQVSEFSQYVDLWGVDVSNGYAYTADQFAYPSRIIIFNVSDPLNPVITGSLDYYSQPPSPWKAYIYGDVLFVGDIMEPYISLVDVSDPSNPTEISQQMIADKFAGIYVTSDFVYLATQYDGLHIYENPFGIVPVELTSFTAAGNGNNVILSWHTATETNNKGFEILRSGNGKDFNQIAFIKGHGTTTNENEYSYIDKNLGSGNYSYKLVQVDFDGARTESQVVSVEIDSKPTEYALKQNYPNPFNPSTRIEYSISNDGNVKLTVFNMLGEEIKTLVNEYQTSGDYKINFDASALPSGIYYYRIETGKFNSVKKMVVLK